MNNQGGVQQQANAPAAAAAAVVPNAQTISLKDALSCVPEFTGEPGTFYAFQKGCEEAKEMIGQGAEENLVRIIRSKVTKEAKKTLRGQTFNTVEELVNHLKEIYFTTKPLYQLYGDLGKWHQRPEERVIEFGNRIREILQKIVVTWRKDNNPTAAQLQTFKDSLRPDAITTLKRGLKPEIEQQMANNNTLADSIRDAVKQEKYLQDKDDLHMDAIIHRQHQQEMRRRTYACQICNDENHEASCCQNFTERSTNPTTPEKQVLTMKEDIKCQICDKSGHSAKNCYHRQKKETAKEAKTCQFCDKKGQEAKNCFKIKNSEKTTTTDKMKLQSGKCMNRGHSTETCFLDISKKCRNCDKVGHLAETCRRNKPTQN